MRALVVSLVFMSPVPALAASFVPLGDLPGGNVFSSADAVSPDGRVVVGSSAGPFGTEAFRWTRDDGMVGLGDLPGGFFGSRAYSLSGDGNVLVGGSVSGAATGGGGTIEAFRWTLQGGMIPLGDLPGGIFDSVAYGVSANGDVVVGSANGAGPNLFGNGQAFRWTSADGMVGLGELPGGGVFSEAWAVSADGGVIVGSSDSASGAEAFRWTQTDGMVGLGDLAGGAFESIGYGVSADGSAIVGRSISGRGFEAFRWTEADGMIGLGDLAGGSFFSVALGASADGNVVVGSGTSALDLEATIWTPQGGMRRLFDVLVENGATGFEDWTLYEARAISPDGRWVVGNGFNPAVGQTQAFLADITPVPIPAAAWLFASALGGLAWLRRR